MSRVSEFLNHRPLSFLLIVASVRTFFYGLLYAIATPDAQQTLMWGYLVEYHLSTLLFGLLLTIVGIASVFLVLRKEYVWSNRLLYFQALLWLFVGVIYLTQGAWLLAVSTGLAWSVVIGYTNYKYKNSLRKLNDVDGDLYA